MAVRRLLLIAPLLLAAITEGACGAGGSEDPVLSERAHTEGELVWSNDPQQWLALEPSFLDGLDLELFAPADSVPARRLEGWLDRYDVAVREVARAHGIDDLVAPKPRARVVIDKDVKALTEVADVHYVLEKGRVVWSGSSAELRADQEVQHKYLGV